MNSIELPELTTPEIILNIYLNGVRLNAKYSNINNDHLGYMMRQNGLELILTQLIKKYYLSIYYNQTKLSVVINRLYHEFISNDDYITESFIKSRVDEIINESIIAESMKVMSHFQCRHKSAKLFNLVTEEYIRASSFEKARYLDFIVNPDYDAIELCINQLLSHPYFSDIEDFNLKIFYIAPTDNDKYTFITAILLKLIGGDAEIGRDRLINPIIIRHTFYELFHLKKVEPLIDRLRHIRNQYNIIDDEYDELSENVGDPEKGLINLLDFYIAYLDKHVRNDKGVYSGQSHKEIKLIFEQLCGFYVKLTK